MFKFGLEKERFLLTLDEKPMVIPTALPADSEGLQLEFRGKPFTDISDAIHSVLADETRVIRTLLPKEFPQIMKDSGPVDNYIVSDSPIMTIPQNTKLEARRQYNKGVLDYCNLYGFKRHKVARNTSTASIHISITSSIDTSYSYTDSKRCRIEIKRDTNIIWDFASFIKYMDIKFKSEIAAAQRRPGFYEIKSDGRFEYRSLPCNINTNKLFDVLSAYKFDDK